MQSQAQFAYMVNNEPTSNHSEWFARRTLSKTGSVCQIIPLRKFLKSSNLNTLNEKNINLNINPLLILLKYIEVHLQLVCRID